MDTLSDQMSQTELQLHHQTSKTIKQTHFDDQIQKP